MLDCRIQQEQASSALYHAATLHPRQDDFAHSQVLREADTDSLSSLQLEADTVEWFDADPMLSLNQQVRPPHSCSASTSGAEFFKLSNNHADVNIQNQHILLAEGISCIRKLQDPLYSAEQEYSESDENWQQRMQVTAPDPEAFKAGRLHSCSPVPESLLSMTGSMTASAKRVLQWVSKGIKLNFVPVSHPSHLKAPKWRKRAEIVKHMLTKAVGKDKIDTYLQGDKPAAVHFPNHQSVNTYKDFVQAEVAKGIHKGLIARWPFSQPPTVVNGLRVVDDKLPKLRLCINPMYVNLFMRYIPVHYEKLTDLVDLLAPEDYMFTSDDKSGY